MSRDVGSIEIRVPFELSVKHWRALISSLDGIGFGLFGAGEAYVQYLPIGSPDNEFDWHFDQLSLNEFFEIIGEKLSRNEQVGFYLTKAEEDGLIVFADAQSDGKTHVTVNLTHVSKQLDGEIISDFNFYLSTLVPIFRNISSEIEFVCSQYIDR